MFLYTHIAMLDHMVRNTYPQHRFAGDRELVAVLIFYYIHPFFFGGGGRLKCSDSIWKDKLLKFKNKILKFLLNWFAFCFHIYMHLGHSFCEYKFCICKMTDLHSANQWLLFQEKLKTTWISNFIFNLKIIFLDKWNKFKFESYFQIICNKAFGSKLINM